MEEYFVSRSLFYLFLPIFLLILRCSTDWHMTVMWNKTLQCASKRQKWESTKLMCRFKNVKIPFLCTFKTYEHLNQILIVNRMKKIWIWFFLKKTLHAKVCKKNFVFYKYWVFEVKQMKAAEEDKTKCHSVKWSVSDEISWCVNVKISRSFEVEGGVELLVYE